MDIEGDGICCSFGSGNYNITDGNGNILLASEGIFTFSETNDFCASLPNRDISITGIEGLSSQNCTADLPVNIDILLLNNGLDLLNSAAVDIVLNDTFLTTIDWTGSLATGQTEIIVYLSLIHISEPTRPY